jgi:16S rRNA (uracil1498-N3)-methyltransferase
MTRLYLPIELSVNTTIYLDKQQIHYLAKVMRFKDGEIFTAFNSECGEWQVKFNKESCICLTQTKEPLKSPQLWLAFAPIKHDALSFLIEKATELGVTNLQPILTDHTNSQRINLERIKKQAIEASEQCERLDVPTIHAPIHLNKFIAALPTNINWYFAMERSTHDKIIKKPCGFIIGPEGGWSETEKKLLNQKVTPISLGNNILRAETAAITCLSIALI